MTNPMITLRRVPSRQHQGQVQHALDDPTWIPYRFSKWDYITPDGRWYIEQYSGCGRGWSVTDTTGEYICTSCRNGVGHATIVRTLAAARAFIAEWSV